ncbi:ABC transporter substrate-binding protein [Frateuria aurantia]
MSIPFASMLLVAMSQFAIRAHSRALLWLGCTLLAGLLAGCSGHGQTGDNPATVGIRIASPDLSAGTAPSAGGGPVEVMYATHALERALAGRHIAVHWVFFKGAGPAINEGLANGQIDFAYLGDLAAIIGRSHGLDTQLIAISDHRANEYLATPPDSPINRVEDLRGKRVALFRGTADQLAFARLLAEHGLSEKDVQEINLDWSASRAALVARQVDAAWGGISLLALKERGLARVPFSTRDGSSNAALQAGLVVRGTFAEHHPELVRQVVEVLAQSAAWSADPANRQALIHLLSTQNNLPEAVYAADLSGGDLHGRFSPLIDGLSLQRLQSSIQAARQAGLIRQDFDAGQWARPEIAKTATAAQQHTTGWRAHPASIQAGP